MNYATYMAKISADLNFSVPCEYHDYTWKFRIKGKGSLINGMVCFEMSLADYDELWNCIGACASDCPCQDELPLVDRSEEGSNEAIVGVRKFAFEFAADVPLEIVQLAEMADDE